MKKILYTLLAAAATMFAVGCNKEADKALDNGGETVEASFQIGFAGAQTKATMSDGTTATQLVVGVYDREAGYVESLSYLPTASEYKKAFASDLTATFKARLVKGHAYDLVFLAIAPDNGVYTIDLAKKTLTASTTGASNAEVRDAFYGTCAIEKVTGNIENQQVTLTRPFAQFNAISTKKDYEAAVASQANFKKSSFTVTAPTVLNLVNGTVGTPAKYELTPAEMPEVKANFEPYKSQGDYWLMANYILAGDQSDVANLTFNLYNAAGTEMASYPLSSTPYKRNYRTNVYGSLLTTEGSFTVVIEPAFSGEVPFVVDSPEIKMYDSTLPAPGSTVDVEVGKTVNFKAIHPMESVVPTYSSSDVKVGTINKDGLFNALKDGKTVVTIAFPAVVDGKVATKADDQPGANYPAVTITYNVIVGNGQGGGGGEPSGEAVTDVLTRATTGVEGNTYTDWSGVTLTSPAVYAGQSAGGNESIQLRSNNNNSGIVTTTSGGKLSKVAVEWNENTADGRELQVYGSNTAYTAPTDLYDDAKKGTLLGSIKKGTSTELVVEGDYTFVGLRSGGSAMYLTSVSITWGGNGGTTPDQPDDPDQPEAQAVTVAQFIAAPDFEPETHEEFYKLTGEITEIKNTTYGNFNLKDETGEVYVYGLNKTYAGYTVKDSGSISWKNNKEFADLGLAVGDQIVIIGHKTTYTNATTQETIVEVVGGYYVSKAGEEPQEQTATITASNVSVEVGKTVSINATTNSSAAITYTSKDESVATVTSAGVVTGVKAGTATITLAVPAVAGKYTAASKDITVTVTAASEPSGDVQTVTVAQFNAAEVSETQKYQLTGIITNLTSTTYGNFDLKDDTGSVYVYGLTATELGFGVANDKSFASLGLKEGDKITIIGYRGVFNEKIEVLSAYFVELVEAAPDPQPGDGPTYKKVSSVTSGKTYLILGVKEDKNYIATPIAATKSYGYLAGKEVTVENDVISGDYEAYEFTFTASGSDFIITQPDNRLIGTDDSHASVQIVDSGAWTVEASGGAFKMTFVSTGKYLQHGDGTYTTFGVYAEDGHGTLPFLYEKQ